MNNSMYDKDNDQESIKEENSKKSVSNQSLIRGLSLIEILSNFPNGCPLAKLSELSGLNKSTTHRMLQSLQSCGYVKPTNTMLPAPSPRFKPLLLPGSLPPFAGREVAR